MHHVCAAAGPDPEPQLTELPDEMHQVLSSAPLRSCQMNIGAKAATGDVLLFLHADCMLPEKSLQFMQSCKHALQMG